jgi:isopentenyl diphosphate isomerase/L-lactate dehydrogenase-like FMN-dependent dehydrogenase
LKIVSIADWRAKAERRLPQAVFGYLDCGADGEVTLRENCRAFEDVTFRPRQAVPAREADLRTTVLHTEISMPAILAPIGYSRLLHPEGDVGACKAAGKAETIYVLSTMSGYRLEEVQKVATGPTWYQLYPIGGRGAVEAVLARAKAVGFSALMVTVDTPVAGMRESDHRNGMAELLGEKLLAKIPYISQFVTHPRWVAAYLLDGGLPRFENIVPPGQAPLAARELTQALGNARVTWEDFRWIREHWQGPIVVKGVLSGDDARRAVDAGAEVVIVSNHGGRQLDCVPSGLRALPEVVAAVGRHCEVLMDGGIRRGSDAIKALCLGARAVLLGRAYAYGLAAGGEAGASRAVEIIRADMKRTMALLGVSSVGELSESYVELHGKMAREATPSREGATARGA